MMIHKLAELEPTKVKAENTTIFEFSFYLQTPLRCLLSVYEAMKEAPSILSD
jgi:hypothetical protein